MKRTQVISRARTEVQKFRSSGMIFRGGLFVLLTSLMCLAFFATTLFAQPTFDIGNSEIAVWNTSGTTKNLTISAVNLIFDEDLALTHRHAIVTTGGDIYDGIAWGFEGPWSYDAIAGDIDVIKDTIGCGEYEFGYGGISFRLNLHDANWGAGSTTSVYRILIEYDGNVKIYIRTPGTSGTWSSAITVTNGARYTYWGLIQGTHSASYTRARTTFNNKRFHVSGDDNQLPLESTGVTDARLDVNLDVHADISIPAGSSLLIEGFDEGVTGNSDTKLLFDNQTGLTVPGELRTVETQYSNEYAVFLPSSSTPAPGDWKGIYCPNPSGVHLNHTFIGYAECGLNIESSSSISGNDVIVSYSLMNGVMLVGSSGNFQHLMCSSNGENNLEVRNSELVCYNSQFSNSVNQNGVVVGDGGTLLLQQCDIYNNRMNGIFGYANAYVQIDSCDVFNNGFVAGDDWQGVYTFYNDWPIFLRHSKVFEQSVGVCAVWGEVFGYYRYSIPVRWDNADSLARNCIYHNDYNLYGYYGTFELAKAYYDKQVPHYQGGESSIFDPYYIQGQFENSQAYLHRDFWDGNTMFNVISSTVETNDALTSDSAGCLIGDGYGSKIQTGSASFNPQAAALYRTWETLSVDSLRDLLYNQCTTLSALDASAGFRLVWQLSDSTAAESYFQRIIANSSRAEVLLPAYRYVAAARMHARDWSGATLALLAMTQQTVYGETGYTSAQAMAALAMHLSGSTSSARASLDTLLQAFPGNRDLVIVDRLIGGSTSTPKRGSVKRTHEANPEYELHAAWPNPFAGTTTISFTLPEAGNVAVTVFDIMGREVRHLADSWYSGGTTSIIFNAGDLPGGLYMLRMNANGVTRTRTIQILK
ncbi:MAG: T9SS type A sorting domain-containing protein [Bacteroidota bacterium]